ncbi:MAG: YitT family protein [Nitrospirae bacterium]|nr:YitT family protein [Nitrospirota bacterium]
MDKFKKESINVVLILLGILSAGMGVKGFLLPSRFIDGGVTGISMLVSYSSGLPLPVLLLVINLPFIVLGYNKIGRLFVLKSVLAITGLAVCLALVHFPVVTQDKLLTSVFGGFFLGTGIGLAIRGGAVLDGTEIVALLVDKSNLPLRVGDVILIFNVVIFSVAVFVLGVEPALYSILTYLAASKTVDFILHGVEEYTAVIIVSEKSDEIRDAIVGQLNLGVTVYKGRGGKTGKETHILYCVVTRLEIGRVRTIAQDIDSSVFVVVHTLSDVSGGIVKSPVFH